MSLGYFHQDCEGERYQRACLERELALRAMLGAMTRLEKAWYVLTGRVPVRFVNRKP